MSHYASIALKKLRTSVQVRNLNSFIAKSELEKTILEGAKLISKWFHFSGNKLTHKLVDEVEEFEKMVKRVEQLVEEKNVTALEDILKCITEVLYGKLSFRVRNYKDYNFNVLKHKAASIHWVLFTFVSSDFFFSWEFFVAFRYLREGQVILQSFVSYTLKWPPEWELRAILFSSIVLIVQIS